MSPSSNDFQSKVLSLATIIVVLVSSTAALAVFLVLPIATNDTSPEDPVEQPDTSDRIIFPSSHVNDTFAIYLMLPESYNATYQSYPVIYLLDADWMFEFSFPIPNGGTKGLVSRLVNDSLIPEVILVGVGYAQGNSRTRDFLYPEDNSTPTSGGGENFYKFMKLELMPFISANYRVNETVGPTLIGHSFGGYFSLYTIMEHAMSSGNNLFTQYITISPTVWYHEYYILELEEALYNRTGGVLPLKIRITMGSEEWEDQMVGFSLLQERIASRNYTSLEFEFALYEGKGHNSVVAPSTYDGLLWLFGK